MYTLLTDTLYKLTKEIIERELLFLIVDVLLHFREEENCLDDVFPENKDKNNK